MSYTMEHCHGLKTFDGLKGKVLTIKSVHGRPFDDNNAVFLCMDDVPENGYLHVIGSYQRKCSIRYEDVLGVLKKEWIPEQFKKQIANIAIKDNHQSPVYFGYSLDEAGHHTIGTPLGDICDVEEYISLQKDIQHEIRITDTDDCLLLKMVEGELIFPDREISERSQHVTMAQTM